MLDFFFVISSSGGLSFRCGREGENVNNQILGASTLQNIDEIAMVLHPCDGISKIRLDNGTVYIFRTLASVRFVAKFVHGQKEGKIHEFFSLVYKEYVQKVMMDPLADFDSPIATSFDPQKIAEHLFR